MIFDLFEAAQEFLSEITPSHVSASTVSQFSHGLFFSCMHSETSDENSRLLAVLNYLY